jgi:hypothetical protein
MAETTISINYSTLEGRVKTHLSIIGKRQGDKQGNTLFTGITLSSAEEDFIEDYIKAAVEIFSGELAPKVNTFSIGSGVEIHIDSTRINSGCSEAFKEDFQGYVQAYVLNAILEMNYSDLAKKYAVDMERHLQAAVKLIYTKEPPSKSGSTLVNMNGSVTLDNTTLNPNKHLN